jgi:hypothetical protein
MLILYGLKCVSKVRSFPAIFTSFHILSHKRMFFTVSSRAYYFKQKLIFAARLIWYADPCTKNKSFCRTWRFSQGVFLTVRPCFKISRNSRDAQGSAGCHRGIIGS